MIKNVSGGYCMKVMIDKRLITEPGIKDFDIDPVKKEIVTVGKKIYFISMDSEGNVNRKEAGAKLKYIESVKFIKEENQLFISNSFFVSTVYGEIYKCDEGKHKVIKNVFSINRTVEYINFTANGKIIYLIDNILYSYNPNLDKTIKKVLLNDNNVSKGKYKIYINNENIVLKYRPLHSRENSISIFDENLDEIFDIKTIKNHIYSNIFDLQYIAGTEDGEIEIWDVITKELYNSIKISEYRISYIEKQSENYFIGLASGELIITDNKFNIIKKLNLHKDDILKIKVNEENIFTLGIDSKILRLRILKENETEEEREKFMIKHNIHEDYHEFFTYEKVEAVENFLKEMKIKNISYLPKEELIFKVFSDSISSRKVCMLGKEPQSNIATGLSFEMKKNSWNDSELSVSLKNILKMIYKAYMGTMKELNHIKNDIENGNFKILPPNKIFEYWQEKGVLFLNTSLTAVENKNGEHQKFWNSFTEDLLEYISSKNEDMVYFLWGKDVQIFEKNIKSGVIIKQNHPSNGGNLSNENDFLNGESFDKTKNIINWTGYEEENKKKLF